MSGKIKLKKSKKNNKNITFINMPISTEKEDKIGISQYASELKTVINQGAQSIAVTSDFGGGKSSLIRYVESQYSSLTTKFCYVNLWSQMHGNNISNNTDGNTGDNTNEIHKSFIYQLASQISVRKGNYVSRRLSSNYGMFGITLPSIFATILSFVMFLFFVIGFSCTTFYDTISEYIEMDFYNIYHNRLGIIAFVIAVFLGLLLIYNTDFVFSSKNSESNRQIDEHELMDVYKTYICRFHFKHYIVVIEDLDRSDAQIVNNFIKELRRYYVPCKRKRSKCKFFAWINDTVFKNINRTTFIVNIKSEKDVATEDDNDLYSKAFDYIINLKEVNVDNYDVILNKLLEDNRQLFKENMIPVFNKDDTLIPEFEWIIRGQKTDLREIKKRLSIAISTYMNLCSKFDKDYITMGKCIAASYVVTAFGDEYSNIKNIGFDKIIDLYVSNPNMTAQEISDTLSTEQKTIEISVEFTDDIKTLINRGLIATDYKQYFYNIPSDSYMYSDKQNELINIILYDKDVSEDKGFSEFARYVVLIDSKVIFASFDRLVRLGKFYPNCIFYSKDLFDLAYQHNADKLIETMKDKLSYEVESMWKTGDLLIRAIKNNALENPKYIDIICDVVSKYAPTRSILIFRRMIIENFNDVIYEFIPFFFGRCPLLTVEEVSVLNGNIVLTKLVDFESPELNIELVDAIHSTILSNFELTEPSIQNNITQLYNELFEVLGTTEKETLTQYLFDIINKGKVIDSRLERLIIDNNDIEDIKERYISAINTADELGYISENTLTYISKFRILKGLCESVCLKLKDSGFFEEFVISSCNTNLSLIDFNEEKVRTIIENTDFLDDADENVSYELLLSIRSVILSQIEKIDISKYKFLFMEPYPIILESEISLVKDRMLALELIDFSQVDEENFICLSKYLCEFTLGLTESFRILNCVSLIKDTSIKRSVFVQLDFEKIQYYRISKDRKKQIIDQMSSAFDFSDISDMILYMKTTKCTQVDFENVIKKKIADEEFKDFEDEYADYIRNAKFVSVEAINNLCALGKIYLMTMFILEKMFSLKKYKYYVVSKTLKDGMFVFEKSKLELLKDAYIAIFLSKEGAYGNTKSKMSANSEFVSFLCNEKLYVGTPDYTRRMFYNCKQTLDCLKDLFDNYDNDFIIMYLSISKGFYDYKAAEYFVNRIKTNAVVSASDEVYNNNYDLLVDSNLKSNFTRYHNRNSK